MSDGECVACVALGWRGLCATHRAIGLEGIARIRAEHGWPEPSRAPSMSDDDSRPQPITAR